MNASQRHFFSLNTASIKETFSLLKTKPNQTKNNNETNKKTIWQEIIRLEHSNCSNIARKKINYTGKEAR